MEALNSICVDVEIQNPNKIDSLPDLSDIQMYCEASIQQSIHQRAFENKLSVLIRVVDIEESVNLNEQYRQKKGPTNILSFPNDAPEFMLDIPELVEQNSHLGDLVICESLVKKEATEQNKTILSHWVHLIVHGMLHLQGYDHLDDAEASNMEALEIRILKKLGFTNPYTNIN